MKLIEIIIRQAEDVDFFDERPDLISTGFGEGIAQEENWGV
ncbi:hypothetical protein Hena1_00970 [Erwinia phage Hena1]|uniref:Uncharacterized protein n=1 Tax=Erwinia phage Hena1 TaxID=2678601 RepID=A0A6B9J9M7_9CAUD|nr:hypothetical protein HWC84_gp096 [Erwinia phage Hena1]QGZ16273.1 hypothetical protein Hena1_00970 [Erwinia phage Hena1]